MNCINCGVKRTGEEKFCLNCGAKLEETIVAQPQLTRKLLTPKQRKIRLISLVSIFVVLAGLLGGYFYLNWKYDASKQIAEMNRAFIKGEKEKFLSYFSLPSDAMTEPDGFYSFVEEEGWEDLREQLKEEITILENDELSNIIKDSYGNKFMSVTYYPLLFGLYNRISFNLIPIEVQVELPLDETSLVINDLTVTGKEGQKKKIGKFLPGVYSWKASVPSEYAAIESSGEIQVIGEGNNTYYVTPELGAGMVSVTSDVQEAELWINDKTTGKSIDEMSSIGPIPFDGTIILSAQSKDGQGNTLKGEQVPVTSDSTHIPFAHVQEKIATDLATQKVAKEKQELKEEYAESAEEYINSFRDSFEYALNYADFSYISSFFLAGSEAQSIYMKEIENHGKIDGYYNYAFQSNTTIGVEALDAQTLYIKTAEVFYFYSDDDDYLYNKTKGYTVKVQNGEFYIISIEQLTTDKEIIPV